MKLEEKIQQHKGTKHYAASYFVDLLRDKYQHKMKLARHHWINKYDTLSKA